MIRYYLKVPGIRGSSSGPNHIGWIDVHSWSFVKPGKLSCHLSATDVSIPHLMRSCAEGKHHETVVFESVDSGKIIYRCDLSDVIISSIQSSQGAESVIFDFTKAKHTHWPQPTVQQRFVAPAG